MKNADLGPTLFSLRSFVAAILAYWIALEIGLARPFWAITTVYLVSQPFAGAVLSKSAYRLAGTILGGAAAVVLVPNFVNQPVVLSLAMATWLGVCMFASALDRTPRAYTFLLAGYTTSIIGFPSVNAPGVIFNTAILRVQEIVIGIVVAGFVHAFIFPSTVTRQLKVRVREIRNNTKAWTIRALSGERSQTFRRERQRLVLDINELQQLSYHLPYDMGRSVPRVDVIRALQQQLSLMVGVVRAVEDRIDVLLRDQSGLPAGFAGLLERVIEWLSDRENASFGAQAGALIEQARRLEPSVENSWQWRDMVTVNLTVRLIELIEAHRNAFLLSNSIYNVKSDDQGITAGLIETAGSRSFHTDVGAATRSAVGAAITVLLACTFWIATEWVDGAVAALIAGVTCALFGPTDNPTAAAKKFLIGSIAGSCLATAYGYVVFPRVTDFVMLAAVLAPSLLFLGSALARPPISLLALGALIGLINTVGLNATYSRDFPGFINGAIAQNVGTAFAIVTLSIFRTFGDQEAVRRLRQAGFRDVIGRTEGRFNELAPWVSRMLDRISMVATRSTAQPGEPDSSVVDALQDLRIGLVAGELRILMDQSPLSRRATMGEVLKAIADFYSERARDMGAQPKPELLAMLDSLVHDVGGDPDLARRRAAATLITSLRCNLFPSATIGEAQL
ncbi:FUSC family protein [Caballeronia sordidicola]|uniref:Fusaric acid resistance protein FUSB / fusaric acid resistance protein FUSC n=1 Tax=Caballeronia sordidicola TaxID=196367 RepID=A0A242M7P2_CABSO|nr:FUSC family protein [Caballeronia sordidicola]OTP67246.1 fusaric acid resistance protein FUSB / fusaric acid resistance protein FUSC [Caballeronia sordidicola]